MSDLFHSAVPTTYIQRVFEIMQQAEQHTFQVLTKRPERAAAMATSLPWSPNIWIGTSIESQRFAFRAGFLREIPAVVRFLSCEPLLGLLTLDLTEIDWVIVGGESGPRARPMQTSWARTIRDQCQQTSTPFFFKQWGVYDHAGNRVGKARAGRMLDGRTWDEMPTLYGKMALT
jgi:protein gp37